jgi:single-stranded-DNA-specific exonuclease
MSLEETADQLAGHLKRQEFVEVYAHHDADGIAAASILCMAMARNEVHFRLRIKDRISPAHVSPDTPTLLCDFGSGLEDLPPEVMVVDHHLPHFQGGLHVNPRLFGIDGDRELSAAGAAYLVARAMGDNRDLSGLVMLGILGDGQELEGQNLEIFNEGAAEGIITNRRGLRLAGRDDHERLSLAVNPYLHQISGDEMAVADLIESSMTDDGMALDTLLSLVILRIGPYATERAMTSIYGDRLILEREVIPDAHSLTAVVDACGKQGQGGLAASLCMRNTDGIAAGWAMTLEHRNGVIRTLREFGCDGNGDGFFMVGEPRLASDVADALAWDCKCEGTVFVVARADELCHISARSPPGTGKNLGEEVRNAAIQCEGFGGGHHTRAGATISCARLDQFRNHMAKVMSA